MRATKVWENVTQTRLGGEFWACDVIAHKTYYESDDEDESEDEHESRDNRISDDEHESDYEYELDEEHERM